MAMEPPALAQIADRMAITDVLNLYCRAIDRMDRDLVLSCWHPGGTDEHTPLFSGTGAAFVDWVWTIHAPMVCTRHSQSNIVIEVDGDHAWSECYWNVLLRVNGDDGLVDIVGGGRYLDFFERIDGAWAIRHRRSIHDWDRVEPVHATMDDGPATIKPNNPTARIYEAARDASDPSYAFLTGHQTHFPLD